MKTTFDLPDALLHKAAAFAAQWRARLEQLPDGTWFNPESVDESFFRALDEVRAKPWETRHPFDPTA